MPVTLFRVIVLVSDIDRAATFYEATLGTMGIRVASGRHYFDCGGVILACVDPGAEGDPGAPMANPDYFYFAVDDIEATRAACLKAGGTPAEGDVHGDPAGDIARRPWGERSFYARDPFGNRICFVDRSTVFTGS